MWISEELERRGWSRSEAARRSQGQISASALDKVIGGYSNPGLDFCNGIATAFNMPLEDVMRIVGILPPRGTEDPSTSALLARLETMDPDDRHDAVNLASAILDYFDRRLAEPPPARVKRGRPVSQSGKRPVSLSDQISQLQKLFEDVPDEDQDEVLRRLLQLRDAATERKASQE